MGDEFLGEFTAFVLAAAFALDQLVLFALCAVMTIFVLPVAFTFRTLRQWFIGITVLSVLLTVPTSNWPLRAVYAISRPSLDQAAERLRAGETLATPRFIGMVFVREAKLKQGRIVCLWTDPSPSGPVGFVQTTPDDLPFNIATHMRLDDSWQFISED